MKFLILAFALFFSSVLISNEAHAQLKIPKKSPLASVHQVIGATDVTVVYSRPSAKDRTVFGELVPWGMVWRAGANENTTVEFSTDVMVNGSPIAAGKYGFHVIPNLKGPWTVIFNKVNNAWGSYGYKKEEDALRVDVAPIPCEHVEMLTFGFDGVNIDHGTLTLSWAKTMIRLDIMADVMRSLLTQAKSLEGWQPAYEFAAYCMELKDYTMAMEWISVSVEREMNFENKSLLMRIAHLNGSGDANSFLEELFKTGTEEQLNKLGYELIEDERTADALMVMKRNVKDHPDSWNAHDSLGEVLLKAGDKKNGVKSYKKALSLTKDENQKARIEKILANNK